MDNQSIKAARKRGGRTLSALIIVYARPHSLAQLLYTLKSSGICTVYISIDGPKNQTIVERQKEIRQVISKFESSNFSIISRENDSNFGVAKGVITAVDWFFSLCSEGIILEDDLVISNSFVDYCHKALGEIRKNSNCLFAGGFSINNFTDSDKSIFFSGYPMIWGWVTDRERWIVLRELILRKKRMPIQALWNRKLQFWYVGAQRADLGFVDTWDTQIAYEFVLNSYYCLLPSFSLVENIGYDDVATHTKRMPHLIQSNKIKENCSPDWNSTYSPAQDTHYDLMFDTYIYRISWRNFFSLYKFWTQYLFDHKERIRLSERIKVISNHKDSR